MITKPFAKIAFVLISFIVCIHSKWSVQQISAAVDRGLNGTEFRSPEIIEQYQLFRNRLRDENISVATYIQDEKFGYDGEAGAPIYYLLDIDYNSQRFPAYIIRHHSEISWISVAIKDQHEIKGLSKHRQFLLVMGNDFPYDVEDGVEHWVVWSNRQVQLSLVNQLMSSILSKDYEYFAYINPPNMKSVPQIFHAQIFVQKTKTIDDDDL